MTEVIYIETNIAVKEHQISVSGVLRYLGVSRSGYHRWLSSVPSQQELRKEAVIQRVIEIHAESYQNYGAPKIAVGTMSREEYKSYIAITFVEQVMEEIKCIKIIIYNKRVSINLRVYDLIAVIIYGGKGIWSLI